MKPYRIPSPLPLLVLLAAILIAGLASCGVANKNRSSSTINLDSSASDLQKSSEVSREEKSIMRNAFEMGKNQFIHLDSGSVRAEFDPSDTARAVRPVIISRDSSGNTIVDPGGRKLKSVTDTRKGMTGSTRETARAGRDSTGSSVVVSKDKTDSSSTHLVKSTRSAETKVFRWQPPWYAYPLVILLALAIWKFRLFRRRPAPVMPYSSPNDPAV